MHIAIIGAGLAGLTCARLLKAAGHAVVVYEKSGSVGGRMATRRNELGGFDHGAQYFTATSEAFRREIDIWLDADWIETWQARLATLDHGASEPAARESAAQPLRRARYVPVPAMHSLARHLANGLDVRAAQRVTAAFREGARWLLTIECDSAPVPATAGAFDAVAVAVPADQAAGLLAAAPALAQAAGGARLAPCWTLMLAFDRPLDLPFDGAWVRDSRLGWIARDGAKPQRRPGERWVAHATPAWSAEHLEDDPERAKEKLLRAFHEATGSAVQPVHAAAHRWRYAQALQPLARDCLWDDGLRLGACGDWFATGLEGAGRVENAWRSGAALANRIGA